MDLQENNYVEHFEFEIEELDNPKIKRRPTITLSWSDSDEIKLKQSKRSGETSYDLSYSHTGSGELL